MKKHIISVGSVDGILTTAALCAVLHDITNEWPTVSWCQAFTVDQVILPNDPHEIYLVDLAVNNRDPQMTRDFVARISGCGHRLVGIVDEHDAAAWREVLGERFDTLDIIPLTRGEIRSGEHPLSGITVDCAGDALVPWIDRLSRDRGFTKAELLALFLVSEARRADLGNFGKAPKPNDVGWVFSPRWLANAVIKPDIKNDTRRHQLVSYFSGDDSSITQLAQLFSWASEYEAMQLCMEQILSNREDLGDDIVRIDTTGVTSIDVTSLMIELYRLGARVVITRATLRTRDDPNPAPRSVFSTPQGGINVLEALHNAGISCGGAPFRVSLDRADETAALAVVRNMMK